MQILSRQQNILFFSFCYFIIIFLFSFCTGLEVFSVSCQSGQTRRQNTRFPSICLFVFILQTAYCISRLQYNLICPHRHPRQLLQSISKSPLQAQIKRTNKIFQVTTPITFQSSDVEYLQQGQASEGQRGLQVLFVKKKYLQQSSRVQQQVNPRCGSRPSGGEAFEGLTMNALFPKNEEGTGAPGPLPWIRH